MAALLFFIVVEGDIEVFSSPLGERIWLFWVGDSTHIAELPRKWGWKYRLDRSRQALCALLRVWTSAVGNWMQMKDFKWRNVNSQICTIGVWDIQSSSSEENEVSEVTKGVRKNPTWGRSPWKKLRPSFPGFL